MRNDAPKKYRIAPSDDYFLVGRGNDCQVLIGIQGTETVCVFFTSDGKLLRLETRAVAQNDDEKAVRTTMAEWLQESGARIETIEIEKFAIPERSIGIRDLPDYLQELVDDPFSFEADRRQHLSKCVSEWEAEGDCVLIWDEEYEMNSQGQITST